MTLTPQAHALITPEEINHLKSWIGKTETLQDVITLFPVQALAATFNQSKTYQEGDVLPELWHWLYFLPNAPLSEVGPDGHPKRGGFLPPVPLPRRMWAGSRLTWYHPLKIGEKISRHSTITAVEHKFGRSSGDLIFVTVQHEITNEKGLAISEEHDIVYRPVPPKDEKPATPVIIEDQADWSKEIIPNEVLLFRYSALTFNGHRIHYDRKYVNEVEIYPGLIVHGPMIATLLVELLHENLPNRRLKTYEFRALRPLFDIHHFAVLGKVQENQSISLWTKNFEGYASMKASATLVTE
jgi:3-methylfumaryl-CoA hydratase